MHEFSDSPGAFSEVWADKLAAEMTVRARFRDERRHRWMLAVTDVVLGQLEARNLADQRELDDEVRCDIARTLVALTPDARHRYPAASTVQEALDGMFEVQAAIMLVLQRKVHWDRLLDSIALE